MVLAQRETTFICGRGSKLFIFIGDIFIGISMNLFYFHLN